MIGALSEWLTSSLGVHVGFWVYLIAGSAVYFVIEDPARSSSSPPILNSSRDDNGNNASSPCADSLTFANLVKQVEVACYNLTGITESTLVIDEDDVSWEFSSALFFSMTILTTIGYGSFAPLTDAGKMFCIIYGFFGIPFCGLFLAKTSDYFSSALLRLYESRNKEDEKWSGILLAATVFLLPGLALFLFFPAAIFMYIEGWTYLDAIYFSFITLTTVGFGDIVATQHANRYWLWIYRISWIIWVYLGIAYWAIIITFITKALKSNELKKRLILISQQAQNMGKPSDAFVASRTKMAMGFALQMAGSVGNFDENITRQLSAPVPGIASALKPSQCKALMTLLQLPNVLARTPPGNPSDIVKKNPSDGFNTENCKILQGTDQTDSLPVFT